MRVAWVESEQLLKTWRRLQVQVLACDDAADELVEVAIDTLDLPLVWVRVNDDEPQPRLSSRLKRSQVCEDLKVEVGVVDVVVVLVSLEQQVAAVMPCLQHQVEQLVCSCCFDCCSMPPSSHRQLEQQQLEAAVEASLLSTAPKLARQAQLLANPQDMICREISAHGGCAESLQNLRAAKVREVTSDYQQNPGVKLVELRPTDSNTNTKHIKVFVENKSLTICERL
jgi:hypothetical protein